MRCDVFVGLIGVLFSGVAFAATFDEQFTSPFQSVGCGSAWVEQCDSNWTAFDETDSVEMCAAPVVESGVKDGILLMPTHSSFPNGVTRELVASGLSEGVLRVAVVGYAYSASTSAGVRVKAYNGNGGYIGQVAQTFPIDRVGSFVHDVSWRMQDSTAVRFEISVGVVGSSAVWLDSVVASYDQPQEDDPTQSTAACNAKCNSNLCPDGQTMLSCESVFSFPPPVCDTHYECEAPVDEDGKSEWDLHSQSALSCH